MMAVPRQFRSNLGIVLAAIAGTLLAAEGASAFACTLTGFSGKASLVLRQWRRRALRMLRSDAARGLSKRGRRRGGRSFGAEHPGP